MLERIVKEGLSKKVAFDLRCDQWSPPYENIGEKPFSISLDWEKAPRVFRAEHRLCGLSKEER